MQEKKKKGNLLVRFLGNEKYQFLTIPLFAILISLLVGAVVLLLLGKNPLDAYVNLLQGSGILPKAKYAGGKSMLTDLFSFMDCWTPMIFASLSVAVALKTGLFNIGVSGQMLAAGFITTITVGYSTLSAPIAKPLVILVAAAVGALVGGLIGFLKYRFNINEVVSSIMLNYIIEYVVGFFINTRYVNPISRQSQTVSSEARLTLSGTKIGDLKFDIPLGIILAVIVVVIVKYIFDRTVLGYELKAVGSNQKASRYAGIPVGKNMILAMMISGLLAGLAGASYYLGYYASIQPKVLSSTGFDAIAVAILGHSNPVGILGSSFLINIISKGSTYMSSSLGVDAEIASVITGLILLFAACDMYIRYRVDKAKENLDKKNERRESHE
ncbi:ABC transporter permease [Blautia sp. 1033sp1_1033st1_G9_1033SCRN_220408]|uniref:ABC transporter permease n=1 Tax=Blautia sp. 1033sp1_1033st1_G9_1033SCRN_220408 TaxID=3144490 RepID=UPI0034A31C6A